MKNNSTAACLPWCLQSVDLYSTRVAYREEKKNNDILCAEQIPQTWLQHRKVGLAQSCTCPRLSLLCSVLRAYDGVECINIAAAAAAASLLYCLVEFMNIALRFWHFSKFRRRRRRRRQNEDLVEINSFSFILHCCIIYPFKHDMGVTYCTSLFTRQENQRATAVVISELDLFTSLSSSMKRISIDLRSSVG